MSRTGYCVGDAMTTKPVTIPPHMTLLDAARLMRENDVGSVVVRDGLELLGILTEWDFVHTVVVQNMDTTITPVSKAMVSDLVTIHPSMDIFDALSLMRDADVRHLPVLEGEKMVGFITLKDILRIQPELFDIISEKYEIHKSARLLK